MNKRGLVIFILAISLVISTSCWSRREIEDLGFAMGIGITKTSTGLYKVVVQFANPSAIVSDNPGSREVYTILQAEGLSVFDAFRNLSLVAGRRLFFPHLSIIVIEESIAKEGISEVVGFLTQDVEIRLESEVLISKLPAEEIFDTPNTLAVVPSLALATVVQNIGANSKIYVADLHGTIDSVLNPANNYVTSLVEKKPQPSKQEMPVLKLSQIAVFDNDKLVGYLDIEEGQGYNLITNNFDNGLIVFERRGQPEIITIEVLSPTVKITPLYSDGHLVFNIDVKLSGNIAERIPLTYKEDDLTLDDLPGQLSKVIEDKLQKTVAKAQDDFGVDIFNLSSNFFRKYPSDFQRYKDNWNEVFSNAEINIKVESTVIHPALGTLMGDN